MDSGIITPIIMKPTKDLLIAECHRTCLVPDANDVFAGENEIVMGNVFPEMIQKRYWKDQSPFRQGKESRGIFAFFTFKVSSLWKF